MLVPAITRKQEIIDNFRKHYYTTDMMYETGGMYNWTPDIKEDSNDGNYQYAVVDKYNRIIGYIGYYIDWYSSCAKNFGMFSFDRGNPIMGEAIFYELKKILHEYKLHRIEWKMVGGNPVEKHYDKFCHKYKGTKHVLKDAFKDEYGVYHDDIIYEIINQI